MLTRDQARHLATVWRPKFDDVDAFETSWQRYMDHYKANRSPETLDDWLARDAEQDEVRAAGIIHEPLLPVTQHYEMSTCYHCSGAGWTRAPGWSPDPSACGPSHPAFGRAVRCPACSNSHHRCEHCTPT